MRVVFLDMLHFIVSATPRWWSVKGTHHLPTKLCSTYLHRKVRLL